MFLTVRINEEWRMRRHRRTVDAIALNAVYYGLV
jgi:hypothetical protein